MAKKLDEFLKAQGATEEDIKAMAPLLSNEKFRAAIENEFAAVEAATARATKAEGDVRDYDKWFTEELTPAYNQALNDATQAKADKAAAEARLRAAQEYGLAKVAEGESGEQTKPGQSSSAAPASATLDPKKFVSSEDFLAAYASTGDAIADATEMIQDHRDLFGTRLPMKELLAEARSKRRPVRAVWEEKYNVAGKRTELDTAAKAAHDKKVADEAVAAYKSTVTNPETRPLMPSRNPFTSKPVADPTQSPWNNSAERERLRVEKAIKTLNLQ